MTLYRAVQKANFDPSKGIEVLPTRRMPSNIPYLVDNIWEWLRPQFAPSRRHAIYASPTPELALANASAVGSDPRDYVVCELLDVPVNARLSHLKVTDARYHADVGNLMRRVAKAQGPAFASLPIMQKIGHAPLYMPGTTQQELHQYFVSTPAAQALAQELRDVSTFWQDSDPVPQKHEGEMFFELPPYTTYYLRPIA